MTRMHRERQDAPRTPPRHLPKLPRTEETKEGVSIRREHVVDATHAQPPAGAASSTPRERPPSSSQSDRKTQERAAIAAAAQTATRPPPSRQRVPAKKGERRVTFAPDPSPRLSQPQHQNVAVAVAGPSPKAPATTAAAPAQLPHAQVPQNTDQDNAATLSNSTAPQLSLSESVAQAAASKGHLPVVFEPAASREPEIGSDLPPSSSSTPTLAVEIEMASFDETSRLALLCFFAQLALRPHQTLTSMLKTHALTLLAEASERPGGVRRSGDMVVCVAFGHVDGSVSGPDLEGIVQNVLQKLTVCDICAALGLDRGAFAASAPLMAPLWSVTRVLQRPPWLREQSLKPRLFRGHFSRDHTSPAMVAPVARWETATCVLSAAGLENSALLASLCNAAASNLMLLEGARLVWPAQSGKGSRLGSLSLHV